MSESVSEGTDDGGRADFALPRRPQKSDAAFRTISEVSEDLDVPQHVLRFWESRFPTIKPLKRGGGRRYYRPEDVQLLRKIRDLLYKDGYTIRGVQKLLRDHARGSTAPMIGEPASEPAPAPSVSAAVPPVALAPVPSQPSLAFDPVVPAPPRPVGVPPASPPGASEAPVAALPAEAPAFAKDAAPLPGGITGARRALIETLLGEIDALREELADAVRKPRR